MHLARGQMILAFGLGSLRTDRVPARRAISGMEGFVAILSEGNLDPNPQNPKRSFRRPYS